MSSEYICALCNKTFSRKYNYERHIEKKKACVSQYKYACETCDYKTNKKSSYEKHMHRKSNCIDKDIAAKELAKIKESVKTELKKLKINARKISNYNFIASNYNDALDIENCIGIYELSDMIDACRNMNMKDGASYLFDMIFNKSIDIRPIHCTDVNRLNYLIRKKEGWAIDANGRMLKNYFIPVVGKVYNSVMGENLRNAAEYGTEDERMEANEVMIQLDSNNISKLCANIIRAKSNIYAINNASIEQK